MPRRKERPPELTNSAKGAKLLRFLPDVDYFETNIANPVDDCMDRDVGEIVEKQSSSSLDNWISCQTLTRGGTNWIK